MRSVRVGDLIELQRRRIEVDPLLTYEEIGIRSFGRGIFHKEPVDGSALGSKRIFEVWPGDLVFNNVFAWEGAVGLAGSAERGRCGSHRFLTYTARTEDVDLAYLRYFFVSDPGVRALRVASPGSAGRNRTLAIERFENLEIPLPDLPEQRRVVRRLERLFDRLAQVELRGGRVAPRDCLSVLPAFTEQVLRTARHVEERLVELVDVVPDVMRPGESAGPAAEFVGLQHVESHSGRRIGSSPLGSEKGDKRRFRPGDVIYGNLRPYLNKAWLADRHGVCSVDQRVLRPREGVDGELLAFAIRSRSILDAAVALTPGLQLPRIRMSSFLELEVPIVDPTATEIMRSKLRRAVDQVRILAESKADQSRRVAALRVGILNASFNAVR
ncbi:MAG: hypothetical protein U0R69_12540 [Gaiellales bacterium]